MENKKLEQKLEQKLKQDFEYTRFSDNHFDSVMLSDFKFTKGKAVAILTRMYETYSPGRDQDHSGIVFTDGTRSSRLAYTRVWDSAGALFGSYKDEDNHIKKIISFDGTLINYEVATGKIKQIKI